MTLVEECEKEIRQYVSKVNSWYNAESVAQSLKAKYPDIVSRISIGWHPGQLNGILIFIDNVKDGKWMKPIFGFLGRHGYLHKGKPDVYGILRRITWNFEDIKVCAFFDGGSDTCKFIKKKSEEYDYELVCPEILGE